ncbi:MAG: hypothetical protein A2X64_06600 [Ignavibacteria bacterium GWF2_33_9]|nr:MAG: hypothetical protein A2X64_06600 [Ignavibacteria bacterium GWF2_33_9]
MIEVRNPFSNEIIETIKIPTNVKIENFFKTSEEYYKKKFKKIPAYQRAEILYNVAIKIKENTQELANLIATEGGKPLKDAIIEVKRAANTVKMSGDEALNLNGHQLTMDRSAGTENHIAFSLKESIGPVLAISAFNHPVNLICHQVATAIAAGNTVILKPAEKTPLCARKICDFFYESGLDKDALIYLPITGQQTQNILNNPAIRYVSFIGSASIGWQIKKLVNPGIKVMLEHGGTAAAVVDKSANLKNTIPSILKGAFYHSGQVCVSTQTTYIHSDIYDEFLEKIHEGASKLIVGDAKDINTDLGPLITPAVVEKMKYFVEDAIKNGARLVLGGKELANNCFETTILTNVTKEMKVFTEEVFGPILNLIKYSNIDEIIQEISDSNFAFQTAIYTQDIDLAFYFARNVEQKACIINDSTAFRVDWMPFGGFKDSGFGTGGIKYAIEDMTEEKLIIIKNNYQV